jgi:MFS transporter, ACS family, solute carrier family 17 (sodium-dependent inorganic phosphate cotransporter), member 5
MVTRPPWKAMFTTKECLAIYVGHFTYNWGNYLFLTQLPTYMKEVLHFDIKSVINQLKLLSII